MALKSNLKGSVKQELKTIFLDEKCAFIWFKLFENYPDKTNEFNQVSFLWKGSFRWD